MSGSTATGEQRNPAMQALHLRHRTSALISSGPGRDRLPPPHEPSLAGGGVGAPLPTVAAPGLAPALAA